MNEQTQLIIETTRRILTDHCSKPVVDAAEQGNWPSGLWEHLEQAGLTLAAISADHGGSGGELADSLLVIREAAKFAAPIPLAETFIAASLLVEAGATVPAGPISIASGAELKIDLASARVSGNAEQIMFGKQAGHCLLVSGNAMALIGSDNIDALGDSSVDGYQVEVSHSVNIAGESISTLKLDCQLEPGNIFKSQDAETRLLHLGAIARVNQMAGAMASMLGMSVDYAMERSQFGRPIAKFQAIQQQLAILAGEVAACQRAADSLLEAPALLDIAIAKARVGEAVQQVTDISHQVHGAMGYTREHGLNHLSRRLWLWRDQYGAESYWQHLLGKSLIETGADNLWARITDAA